MIPKLSEFYPDFERDLLQACQNEPISEKLSQAMSYSLLAGGKRIRPLLALVTCLELGGRIEHCFIPALALEMIHTYSLIHDDLPSMDDDDLRRGKPTNHKTFGEAHAILAGDGLLTLAFDILSKPSNLDSHTQLKLIQTLSTASGHKGMVGGQALDMESENQNIDLPDLEKIHLNKTGKLIAASLEIGALIATQDFNTYSSLQDFGALLGLAFQVSDDLMDVTQSEKTMGKDAGSDLKHNKATYPKILGLEETQNKLKSLHQDALSCLETLAHPCTNLRGITDFVCTRTH